MGGQFNSVVVSGLVLALIIVQCTDELRNFTRGTSRFVPLKYSTATSKRGDFEERGEKISQKR